MNTLFLPMTEACKKFYPFLLFLLFFIPQASADSLDYSNTSVTKLIDISRDLESTNIHESIRILKVAILLPEANVNKAVRHRILIDLSSAQMQSGDYKSAINTAYKALYFAEESGNFSRIGESQFIIGWIFKELNVLLKARNHFEAAMKSYQKAKDLHGFLQSKTYVGHCLTDYGSVKKNSWYLGEAEKIYLSVLLEAKNKKLNLTSLQCNNNLSNLYLIYYQIRKKEIDLTKSRNYSMKCIEGSLHIHDTLGYAIGYSNYGEAYGLEGQIDSLKKHLDFARVIYVKQQLPEYIFPNCQLLIRSYLSNRRLKDAEELLKEYERYIKKFQFLAEYKFYYEYCSELEYLKGNYKAAYEYRLQYNKKLEQNTHDENSKELVRLQFLYDLNKKNEEIAILNRNKLLQSNNNENQVVIRNLLIGSIALLVALLVFIYVRYKDRVSSNRLILSKNKELERLSIVASNTNNGITITNAHGVISWINEGFVRLYGWDSSEDFLENKGTSIYNASGLTRAELSAFIDKAVEAKESIIFQSFKNLKNQEQKYIQTSLTPVFDEQDELKFLVYVDTDITDLLEARELAIREKRKAENALKTQELFLANVSHEIRTPMNGIIGLTRQLNDERLTDSQQEILNTLDASANGLLHVVNDLLDVSKIRAGKMTFEYVRFSLRDLLTTFVSSMSYRSEEKKLRLNLEFTEKLPNYIIGDPIRLNQILLNIVGNAIKFTIEGSITLKVYTIEQRNGMERIHFEIQDTGIGIPEHKQDFVFENFMQIEDHRTRTTSGTGLGLGIAKSLVEAMGGEIHLFSKEGQGTTVEFELSFELYNKHVETKNMVQEDIVLSKDLNGLRILLVEDNKINQRVILYDLKKWNVEVTVVDNAMDGIAILKDQIFDLVLMDYYMPRMDGMEATIFIRTKFSEPTCSIPIIAITASAMIGDQKKFIEVGMNDYISKPFNPEKLYQLLVKWSSQGNTIIELDESEKKDEEFELIDLSILEERAEGSEEYLLEMYGAYLEMMPQYSLDLIQFYEDRDLVELRKQAHQILSPARLFGMHITADLLLKLEKDQTLNEEEMKDLVSEIVNQIQLCEKVIRDQMKRLESK